MKRTIVVAALFALALVACGGKDGGSAQDERDASADALAPGVAYVKGGVACCAEGLGDACCAGDAPCAPYGGAVGACTGAGGGYSGKDVCTFCCDGLVPIGAAKRVDGACVGAVDAQICAPCGDGTCAPSMGENPCSCPADCPGEG